MKLLSLTPPETFRLPVVIPRPGARPARFMGTFKRRGRSELVAFVESLKKMDDPQAVAEVLVGWELSDDFTPANIATLCETVPAAGYTIVQAYLTACFGEARPVRRGAH